MVRVKKDKSQGPAAGIHPVMHFANFAHSHVLYLNNSKLFAGIIMILLNIGSKFVIVNFSKSTEEYLKFSITKQILVFAMSWMGTRDIYAALVLTATFVILSDHLFNEESPLCIVPHSYRVLAVGDGSVDPSLVTDAEIDAAIATLVKQKTSNNNKDKNKDKN